MEESKLSEIDRNKTELTHNVTRLAALWLDSKGFKPVATEVSVSRGWVADVAGIIVPTQTELIDLKLVRRPPRYDWTRRDRPGYHERYRKLQEGWDEEYRKASQVLTALIEVKTSVGDFRRDVKFAGTGSDVTNLRYLALPSGMIEESSWPKEWGILLYGSLQHELNGEMHATSLRCVRPSPLFTISVEQSRDVAVQLAIRLDHATRYARIRALNKEIRIKDAERKSITRIGNAISFILRISEGHAIEDAKIWAGIRGELPGYILERIADFRETLKPSQIQPSI